MRNTLTTLLILLLGACATPQHSPATVNHVVLVWFKDSVSASEIINIRTHSLALQSIPGVLSIQAGSAILSERPIVDDSFDLGLVMTFDSAEAMHEYLIHPRHKAFVNRYIKGKVKRLQVYDIRAEAP